SSSWRFPNRWKRIIVSSAGMYVEIALAAGCVLGWLATDPGTLNTTLHSAIIAATFITVVFNANPLMRFDGYYILADLLGIPNLASKGQQFMKWLGKRVVLGMKDATLPPEVRKRPIAIPLYGILAAIWKVVIWVGIMVTLSLLLKGAGLFLALVMCTMLVVGSLVKFVKFLFAKTGGPKLTQALPRLAIILLAIAATLWLVRINPTGKAVAVVEYGESSKVRVGCEGIVRNVLVASGQSVKKGDILLELTNPDEEILLEQLQLELAETRIRQRSYYQQGDLASFQAEAQTIIGLEKKVQEKSNYLAQLRLRAEIDGEVVGRQLDSLPGQWMQRGLEVMSIIPNQEKELLLSFRQRDIEAIRQRKNNDIKVLLRGRADEFEAEIERIESRATHGVPHEVLAVPNGGPLSIRASSDPESERESEIAQSMGESADFLELGAQATGQELARARFAGRAKIISGGPEKTLLEGEWGYARLLGAEKERLGIWLYEEIRDFVGKKVEQAKMAS
ncbi:MAG: HlyD family efflux transporter periplasmic adaptor subunit, partial [Verrucomicrobiota bacterium]